jgi:hypothetical protein
MFRSVFVLLIALPSLGCNQLNADCRWPSEDSGQLNLRDPADEQHLLSDVRIAEDLAIRYGDTRWAPGPMRWQERDGQCLNPLFGQIASRHAVTLSDVLRSRERLSERGVDLIVNLPIGVCSVLIGLFTIRRLTKRFPYGDELAANVVGTALASMMVGGITLGFGRLWEGAVEMIRIGNDHLSYRGLRLQWTQHPAELFILGVAVVWILSLACYWISERRDRNVKGSPYAV